MVKLKEYNYYELMDILKQISLSHPYVNNFLIGEYGIIGAESDIKYPAIVVQQQTFQIGSQVNTYGINIMYVDRQTDDRDNTLEIQSVAIDTLAEIINAFKCQDIRIDEQYSLNVHKNKFADLTAGAIAYINLRTRTNLSDCFEFEYNLKCKNC